MPFTLVGPNVTRPVQDPLAVNTLTTNYIWLYLSLPRTFNIVTFQEFAQDLSLVFFNSINIHENTEIKNETFYRENCF